MRVPLTSGAYEARSVIASAQRSVNLISERNGQDSPSPFTYYAAPGLTRLSGPLNVPGRGLYLSTSNDLYYVAGSEIYYVDRNWNLTALYQIYSDSGAVSFSDNGSYAVLVDGTTNGYTIDLNTRSVSLITAAAYSPPPSSGGVYGFYGATTTAAIDGYLLFNQPGTRNFYSTYENEIVFDSLYFAAKNGYSDPLVAVIVCQRLIYLIGTQTTELWIDAGLSDFPFQIQSGLFLQHGCSAPYSIAQIGGGIFFLGQNSGGDNVLLRVIGYQVTPISTQAIAYEWATYPKTTDAVGFCFQQDGHTYYQINFPSADKSWRWDDTTQQWAEIVSIDTNGAEHRHRVQQAAFAYGTIVGCDYADGRLYAIDPTAATDDGMEMIWSRGWPHLMTDNRRVRYTSFTLDCDVGGVPDIPSAAPPLFNLEWSDTRGATWSSKVQQSLGASGQYVTSPTIKRLGLGRDRVFRAGGTIPGPEFAVNGAFIDMIPSGS